MHVGWKRFFGELKNAWQRHGIDNVAASVTFFGVLGLFPFLIFLFSLASLVIDSRQAEDLVRHLGQVTPPEVTVILGNRVRAFSRQPSLGLMTLGALGAAWSATGAVVALMSALNAVHGVEERRPFWKVHLIAFIAMLLGTVGGFLAALIGVAAPALANALGPGVATAVDWLRLPMAGLVMMMVWAVLYHFLPDVEQRFRLITPGSVAGVILWLVASWGFSLYLAHFSTFHAIYGALGGVVVLLLWMWISSMVLLLGAAINIILQPAPSESGQASRLRTLAPRPS